MLLLGCQSVCERFILILHERYNGLCDWSIEKSLKPNNLRLNTLTTPDERKYHNTEYNNIT